MRVYVYMCVLKQKLCRAQPFSIDILKSKSVFSLFIFNQPEMPLIPNYFNFSFNRLDDYSKPLWVNDYFN